MKLVPVNSEPPPQSKNFFHHNYSKSPHVFFSCFVNVLKSVSGWKTLKMQYSQTVLIPYKNLPLNLQLVPNYKLRGLLNFTNWIALILKIRLKMSSTLTLPWALSFFFSSFCDKFHCGQVVRFDKLPLHVKDFLVPTRSTLTSFDP